MLNLFYGFISFSFLLSFFFFFCFAFRILYFVRQIRRLFNCSNIQLATRFGIQCRSSKHSLSGQLPVVILFDFVVNLYSRFAMEMRHAKR